MDIRLGGCKMSGVEAGKGGNDKNEGVGVMATTGRVTLDWEACRVKERGNRERRSKEERKKEGKYLRERKKWEACGGEMESEVSEH